MFNLIMERFSSVVLHLSQVAPVEGTSEGKPAAAVDIETATKCLPFKNPNFVVRVFSQKAPDVLGYISTHS